MDRSDYTLIRSRRRTVSVEIKPDASIVVRAPKRMPLYEIDRFVDTNSDWIKKHLKKVLAKKKREERLEPITEDEIAEMTFFARIVIPQKVDHFARQLGVLYNDITIKNQKTLWGSCSAKGNLNFNCLLMKTPEKIQDYVVVHELCHLLEMNHSKAFWKHVEKLVPDHRECRRWLKEEGAVLFARREKIFKKGIDNPEK